MSHLTYNDDIRSPFYTKQIASEEPFQFPLEIRSIELIFSAVEPEPETRAIFKPHGAQYNPFALTRSRRRISSTCRYGDVQEALHQVACTQAYGPRVAGGSCFSGRYNCTFINAICQTSLCRRGSINRDPGRWNT